MKILKENFAKVLAALVMVSLVVVGLIGLSTKAEARQIALNEQALLAISQAEQLQNSHCALYESLKESANTGVELEASEDKVTRVQEAIYNSVAVIRELDEVVGVSSDCISPLGEEPIPATVAAQEEVSSAVDEFKPAALWDGAHFASSSVSIAHEEENLEDYSWRLDEVEELQEIVKNSKQSLQSTSTPLRILDKENAEIAYENAVAGLEKQEEKLEKAIESANEAAGLSVMNVSLLDELKEGIAEAEEFEVVTPEYTNEIEEKSKEVRELREGLEKQEKLVRDSNTEWEKEQERIAAERAKEAQAIAAVQGDGGNSYSGGGYSASTGVGTYSSGSASSEAAPSYSSGYTLYASNCGDAYNAQACVDGSSITYIDYSPWGGPQWVGGHNYGAAGVISSFNVGDTVTVVGSGAAGTYRVTGISWIPKVSGTSVNSIGGGFAFQTCVGNQMKLAYAVRI